jgi:anti-anti-sigma factor
MKQSLIQVRSHNGLVTVDLRGELDRSKVDRLRSALGMAGRLAAHTVVIDTTQLDFVDVTSYRLITAYDEAGRIDTVLVKGGAVRKLEALLGAHPPIRDHAA